MSKLTLRCCGVVGICDVTFVCDKWASYTCKYQLLRCDKVSFLPWSLEGLFPIEVHLLFNNLHTQQITINFGQQTMNLNQFYSFCVPFWFIWQNNNIKYSFFWNQIVCFYTSNVVIEKWYTCTWIYSMLHKYN